jgi:hypothetical protein
MANACVLALQGCPQPNRFSDQEAADWLAVSLATKSDEGVG